jgi:hypothetical protein
MKTNGKRIASFVLGAGLLALSTQTGSASGPGSDELYARRFALLVGANNGGKERVVLRYAVDDARAIKEVLEEMGGVLAGDTRFLADPKRELFIREMKALAGDVARAKGVSRRVEVVLYYSGHSDEECLFLGDGRVSYAELRDLIMAIDADVRIAILDSCASGALTVPKGVIKKPPFLMDTAYDMKGYAFMTSSSANEAAQESGRLRRSYFTHNLISGLRGAADMNQDSRITLNEAYQFAFDGTLAQTENTLAGPQHPSRHIQMSGTGDVVVTELWKSSSVLTIPKEVKGRIYVHNARNALVLEMKKAAGREVSVGLESGDYRIIIIDGGTARESRITLASETGLELKATAFTPLKKVPATLRGDPERFLAETSRKSGRSRWRLEVSGGLAAINPADLNLRATFDAMYDTFYTRDYLNFLRSQGEIVSFSERNEGGVAEPLKRSAPWGIRLRYGLSRWLDLSLGFTSFRDSRESTFQTTYEILQNDGGTSVYTDQYDSYALGVRGASPSLGVHFLTRITPLFELEASISGGPLFAECRYSISYRSQWPDDPGGNTENPENGLLEEIGRGVGLALNAGAKLNLHLAKRYGLFVEGGYAYQRVPHVRGPGIRTSNAHRDTWEGEWGIKQDVRTEPWGTARFLWPSNGWVIFGGTWWQARDFRLDLSGIQARVGLFYRF